MFKLIMNGLGAVVDGVAKVASAINNSTAFKLFKGAISATVGIPLAVVGTAVVSVAWAGIKVGGLLDSKIIKGVFGSSIWEDTAWSSRLESTEKFMRSIWEDFGVYSHLKVAKFIGDQWAERQSEAGYGNAQDDSKNRNNFAALSNNNPEQVAQAGAQPKKQDLTVLNPIVPGNSPEKPFLASTHNSMSNSHGHGG